MTHEQAEKLWVALESELRRMYWALVDEIERGAKLEEQLSESQRETERWEEGVYRLGED